MTVLRCAELQLVASFDVLEVLAAFRLQLQQDCNKHDRFKPACALDPSTPPTISTSLCSWGLKPKVVIELFAQMMCGCTPRWVDVTVTVVTPQWVPHRSTSKVISQPPTKHFCALWSVKAEAAAGHWSVNRWKCIGFVEEILPSRILHLGIMEYLEVLEYSGIFISNPEYRVLFRNNLLPRGGLERRSSVTRPVN